MTIRVTHDFLGLVQPGELPRLARPKGCYAVRDIRSIGEQSGRTTGRLGSTGLQSVPLEGRHSWALWSSSAAAIIAGPHHSQ